MSERPNALLGSGKPCRGRGGTADDTVRSNATVDWTGRFSLTVHSLTTSTPGSADAPLALTGLFSNPATDVATFEVGAPEATRLEVFNALGRRVLLTDVVPGAQRASLDTSVLAGGVYVVRVASGETVETRRMTVAR